MKLGTAEQSDKEYRMGNGVCGNLSRVSSRLQHCGNTDAAAFEIPGSIAQYSAETTDRDKFQHAEAKGMALTALRDECRSFRLLKQLNWGNAESLVESCGLSTCYQIAAPRSA